MTRNPLGCTLLGNIGQISTFVLMLSSVAFAQSGTRLPDRTGASQRSGKTSQPASAENRGIAVVELFTSQGCSSCPPADQTLQAIAEVASKSQLPVYVLSFHVDYWNRLGWTDPYSDAAYSQRQRAYAAAAGSDGVYTPQMIVNGSTEFNGSDRKKANKAITSSLSRPSLVNVKVAVQRDQAQHSLRIQYELSGNTRGGVLNLAAVQTPKPNAVPRGENSGRDLSHVNVVRAFETIKPQQRAGTAEIVVPSDVDLSNLSLIAYVQNPETSAILGAARSN